MADLTFRIAGDGMGFTEGPVFRRAGDVIVTSIDRGHLYSVSGDGVKIFAVTGGAANGATEGPDGAIYLTQAPRRRWANTTGGIQRARPDGVVEWITADPLSPNDLCFGPDGLLWVTDPTRRPARNDSRLFRVDVATREAELVISTDYYTNGIAFSEENDAVYVVSTGERLIVRYPIVPGGLGKRETVVRMDHGHPDGFAFDAEGHFVIAVNGEEGEQGDVQVFDRSGKLLETLRPMPGRWFTNLAISEDRRLVVTHPDRGALLEAEWPYSGLPLHPFRS